LQNTDEIANRSRKTPTKILALNAIVPVPPAKPSRTARTAMVKKANGQLVIKTLFPV